MTSKTMINDIQIISTTPSFFRKANVRDGNRVVLSIRNNAIKNAAKIVKNAAKTPHALLLPIPLTVYLREGLERLGVFDTGRRLKAMVVVLLVLGVFAFGYATSVIWIGYPYAYTYMPSGLVESAIPFEDVADLNAAFEWVNEKVPLNSVVIVAEKMMGLAYLDLRSDVLIRVAPSMLQLILVSRWLNLE